MSLPSATRPIVVGASFDESGADLGKGTRICLRAVANLARRTRAEVEIVHAVQENLSPLGRTLLVQARDRLCAGGVRAQVNFCPGRTARALCTIALTCDAGLIVVGGSPAAATDLCRELAEQSPWPVIAVCVEDRGLVLLTSDGTQTAEACGRILGAPIRLLPVA